MIKAVFQWRRKVVTSGNDLALPKAKPQPQPKGKARLFARLRGGHGHGDSLTVSFGAPALLSGRLTRADGASLAGQELRVVSHPSHGALVPIALSRRREVSL